MLRLMTKPRILAPTDEAIADAAHALAEGRLVAFPTETVYGLGGDASDDRAVAAIFEAKGRPRFNPLIVHWRDAAAARQAVIFAKLADELAARFWPGPLTLILPRRSDCRISLLCSAGLDSLAVRVPSHPLAQRLLAAAARPIAAPSANRAGSLSPTTASHVAASLGDRIDIILDGGRCPIGLESSVVDLTGERPVLLRPGAIPREEIEALAGPLELVSEAAATPRSPGQLASHYAPHLPLRLDVTQGPRPGEALLAFGPNPPSGFAAILNLSPAGDLVEAAANFFAMLHALDRPELYSAIAVMPVPEEGLGAAINDRLRRGAAPRGAR